MVKSSIGIQCLYKVKHFFGDEGELESKPRPQYQKSSGVPLRYDWWPNKLSFISRSFGVLEPLTLNVTHIDIESLQNRLLNVCYVPATSAGLPRVSFFFSFLFLFAVAINSTK
jgi:hypothetical protein